MKANRHAHHEGAIRLVRRDGVELDERIGGQNGAAAYWQDGSTSYLLHTRTERELGFVLADEADTVIQFVDRLHYGEPIEADSLEKALRDIRGLRNRLEAIEGEAILYARESASDDTGRVRRRVPRLNFHTIANALGIAHSTVIERHEKMTGGRHAAWRRWLVQGTPRARMYAGTDAE
jgi:hypothetical protein